MKKIVTFGANLTDEQKQRLEKVGEVGYLESPSSLEEFLSQAEGADIIFSDGSFLLENLPKLKNVFVTYPFIELGAFNSEELKKNGVFVANTRGSNRDSIVEWVVFMILSLFRQFIPAVRSKESFPLELKESLGGKKVLIIGRGNIGTKVGVICEVFGMKVIFFQRGDNLLEKANDTDMIINCLNVNTSSKNLLDKKFFMSLKRGSYFVSFVRQHTYDLDGLIKAIDDGVLAGAAIDCDPEKPGDISNEFYQKALGNPKILVTPHIAFSTKQAIKNGAEFAVQNIEAFVAGDHKNLLMKE